MSTRDRRKTPRHVPVRDLPHVGWWDGPRFRRARARLRDLSSTGVAITVDGEALEPLAAKGLAPEERVVWVCLPGGGAGDWVRSRIVRCSRTDRGERRFGLRFEGPCPNGLFREALWGEPVPDGSAP